MTLMGEESLVTANSCPKDETPPATQSHKQHSTGKKKHVANLISGSCMLSCLNGVKVQMLLDGVVQVSMVGKSWVEFKEEPSSPVVKDGKRGLIVQRGHQMKALEQYYTNARATNCLSLGRGPGH